MSKRKDGLEQFENYYSSIYGDRWTALKASLVETKQHVTLNNPFFPESQYWMDKASIFAAESLNVKAGDNVLDMCAAPGGKTLVLAIALNGQGELFANDRSSDRRAARLF